MPNEENVVKIDRYNAIEFSVYKSSGKTYFSLLSLHLGSNEVWYWDKCLPEKWFQEEKKRRFKTEEEKPEPVKVKLGEKENAIRALEELLVRVKNS